MSDDGSKSITSITDVNPSITEEYKIGPGRPPKEYRFKKGAPSPNPRGRPRKQRTTPDLKKELEGELAVKVQVKKGDKFVPITKGALGIQQLVNQYAKGDRYARRDLLEIASKLGVNLFAGIEAAFEQIAPNHEKILKAYTEQQKQFAEGPNGGIRCLADRTYSPRDLYD